MRWRTLRDVLMNGEQLGIGHERAAGGESLLASTKGAPMSTSTSGQGQPKTPTSRSTTSSSLCAKPDLTPNVPGETARTRSW